MVNVNAATKLAAALAFVAHLALGEVASFEGVTVRRRTLFGYEVAGSVVELDGAAKAVLSTLARIRQAGRQAAARLRQGGTEGTFHVRQGHHVVGRVSVPAYLLTVEVVAVSEKVWGEAATRALTYWQDGLAALGVAATITALDPKTGTACLVVVKA